MLSSNIRIFSGISIRSSFTQSANAPAPISQSPFGNVTVCINRHPRNASAPISHKLSGKITLSIVSLPANASSAILVIPSGMMTLVSAPRYCSSIVPLILKFPNTCLCITRTGSGTSAFETKTFSAASCSFL